MKTLKRFMALTGAALLLFISACKKDSDTDPGTNGNENGNGNQNAGDSIPRISAFSPTSGAGDTLVTITGSAFSNDKSTITVKFGTTAATDIVSATATEIKVKVPKAAVPGKVKITVAIAGKESTSTNDFTIDTPTWQKLYGGNNDEFGGVIYRAPDGGYIMAGTTLSNNSGDVGVNKGNYDFWIIKADAEGNKVWQKTYGGTDVDVAGAITGTANGGVLVTGYTHSNNSGDVGLNNGDADIWLLNLDANGNLLWQKTIGGTGLDYANAIIPSGDGGFVIAASVYPLYNYSDFVLLKLNANGNVLWQKTYGGSAMDYPNAITASGDGGFVVCGYTESNNNGNVGNNHGKTDAWVLKVDANGNFVWQKTLGGSESENATGVLRSADGGFIITGSTSSNNNGDVGANHGNLDLWVLKLNASGNLLWQKTYGGAGNEFARSAIISPDGNYVVNGYTTSTNSGDVVGTTQGNSDLWVIKISADGNLVGQSVTGGEDYDEGRDIVQAPGGGYVISGITRSFINSGSGPNHGGTDLWLVRIKEL